MAARTQSGSKLVVLAVAATVGMIGIGTIWAPFYADRDKLRGLHEEADSGLSDSDKKQYEAYMRQHQNGTVLSDDGAAAVVPGPRPSNSMWGRLNQAAAASASRQQDENNNPRK
jgi:hypothetical protein